MTWLKFNLLVLNITCFYPTASIFINRTAATIEYLNSSSGLFIEGISYLKLYDAEWNIISKINLSYFASETQKIKIIVKNLVDLKFQIDQVPHNFGLNESNEILNEFNNIVNEIEQYNHEWFSLETKTNEKSNYRGRRAIISSIGGISRVLFGTLDEDDEANLQIIFEKLQENNIDDLNSSRMRTSILKTSVERFTNTSKMLDEQTNNVNKKIEEIKQFLNDFKLNMKTSTKSPCYKLYQYSIISSLSFKYRSVIDYLFNIGSSTVSQITKALFEIFNGFTSAK